MPDGPGAGREPTLIDIALPCGIASPLAVALREARERLALRWLERIAQRSNLHAEHVFPSEELLDHVPLLIDAIAAYVERPENEITAESAVAAKAMELGELRHGQGFQPHEILREFEILGGILLSFLANTARALGRSCPPEEAFVCAHRVHRSLAVIQRTTTMHYLRRKDTRIHEREQRLRRFNTMISHELRNRLNALLTAADLLTRAELAEEARRAMAETVAQSSQRIGAILDDLTELSGLDVAGNRARNLPLATVVEEAMRQLRDMAKTAGVALRVAGRLPRAEVNAAAVELCLVNYLSNAIKYSDPQKGERWVEVRAAIRPPAGEGPEGAFPSLVVSVADNGLGVPEEARPNLFERFFRAHEQMREVEGSGIGLSIVRETIESFGGRAWAEFPPGGGSIFCFSLRLRRADDVAAADPTPAEDSPLPL